MNKKTNLALGVIFVTSVLIFTYSYLNHLYRMSRLNLSFIEGILMLVLAVIVLMIPGNWSAKIIAAIASLVVVVTTKPEFDSAFFTALHSACYAVTLISLCVLHHDTQKNLKSKDPSQ